MTPAKRGDLVLVEERTDHGADPRPSFTIERVAGIRRDGFVMRTARRVFGQDGRPEPLFRKTSNSFGEYLLPRVHYRSHLVIPAVTVDVVALWGAWSERCSDWPGREGTNPAFRDLDEARSFVARFRHSPARSADEVE